MAGRQARDRGSATAEVALALPAVVLVTALCVAAVATVATHVRCLDAARAAARELARGEPESHARATAAARAPDGARVTVAALGEGLVSVDVRTPAPGWLRTAGLVVGGEVVAAVEGPGP